MLEITAVYIIFYRYFPQVKLKCLSSLIQAAKRRVGNITTPSKYINSFFFFLSQQNEFLFLNNHQQEGDKKKLQSM